LTGFDGAKKRKGRKVHLVLETLGHLLSLTTSPANKPDRMQEALWHSAQELTGGVLEMVCADQGDTGEQVQDVAHKSKIALIVVKHPEASRGVVLLPKRWVVEHSLAWLSRFRRLGRDLERLLRVLRLPRRPEAHHKREKALKSSSGVNVL